MEQLAASALTVLLSLVGQARDSVAPPAAAATASVSGIVVALDDPATPIRRAVVTIRGGAIGVARSAVTDDGGGFTFDRLPAGAFTLSASKPAYLTSAFGAKRPGQPATPIAVATGQHVAGLTIELARGGVIAGTIRDATGDPASGWRVLALRSGEPPHGLSPLPTPGDATVVTDDRGAYRIYGLAPGEYVVAAVQQARQSSELHARSVADVDAILRSLQQRTALVPRETPSAPAAESPLLALAPIYFPGTPRAGDATPVSLEVGTRREDVDFTVGPVPSSSIDGSIARPAGAGDVQLFISGDGQPIPLWLPAAPRLASALDAGGHFKYVNVTPGRYTIAAVAQMPNSAPGQTPQLLWASADVDVNGSDLTDVSLVLQPALTFAGRVAFNATSLVPPSDLTRMVVRLETLPGYGGVAASNSTGYGGLAHLASTNVRADGTFDVNVLPGTYRLTTVVSGKPLPDGWWLRSVDVGGHDVADGPLIVRSGEDLTHAVVTFTDRHTELTGLLEATGGQPALDYSVVVFPADRGLWMAGSRRIRSAHVATDGRFTFADLPPGDYLLAAVTDADAGDLGDLRTLDQIAAAGLKVTLGEGEHKRQDLRLAR